MVSVVNLTTAGNLPIQARIFSLRGCHLIAMLARTQIAKAFRVWVLDVLETLNKAKPAPEPKKKLPALPLRALPHVEQAALPSRDHSAAMRIKALNPAPGLSGEYYEAELLRVFRDFAAWHRGTLARMEELERDYSRVTGLLHRDVLARLMEGTPSYMTDMGVWAMGERYQDAVKSVREGVHKWERLFSKAEWFAKTLRVNR